MTVLSWNSQYHIGDRTIDENNKILFKIINEFYSYWAVQRHSKDLIAVLKKLTQHGELHFQNEEEIMKRANYPEWEDHRQEHKKLLKLAAQINDQFTARGHMTARDVQLFCKHWLIDHIIQYDYEFRDFLANKNSQGRLITTNE